MKKLITISLLAFIASCAPIEKPVSNEYWKYDEYKWIGYREKVELAWDYDEKITEFEIDREEVELTEYDIDKIREHINANNKEKLIEKEKELRNRIEWDKKVIVYQPSEERAYVDQEEPPPQFGWIYFYQVRAIKGDDYSHQRELSIILVEKPK